MNQQITIGGIRDCPVKTYDVVANNVQLSHATSNSNQSEKNIATDVIRTYRTVPYPFNYAA